MLEERHVERLLRRFPEVARDRIAHDADDLHRSGEIFGRDALRKWIALRKITSHEGLIYDRDRSVFSQAEIAAGEERRCQCFKKSWRDAVDVRGSALMLAIDGNRGSPGH